MQATLTPGSPISGTVTAVGSTSVLSVEGTFKGSVSLQALFPGGTRWFPIATTTTNDSSPILTPDPNVSYRVASALLSGSAEVYFGESI